MTYAARRTLGTLVAAVLLGGLASSTSAAADWPQLGFSARRAGNGIGETTLAQANVSGLQLAWRKTWRCGGIAPPVVAAGRVYVGSSDRVCVFDAATGATLLQIPAGSSLEASPAVATIGGKRRLFVSSLDGALYSFAANTGRLLWKVQTGGPVHSSPAVDAGRVYVGSEDGRLYAIDGITGAVAWSQDTGSPIYGSAAVGFDAAYVIAGSALRAYDVATGALRFTSDYSLVPGTGPANGGTPAVLKDPTHYANGGTVFFTNGAAQDPFLLRADPVTGDSVGCSMFRYGTSPRYSTFAIGGGILYFQTPEWLYSRNASYCASRVNRLSIDLARYPVAGSTPFTGPAIANAVVYDGTQAFASFVTYETPPLWQATAPATSPSVIADGRLFAVVDGKVAAFGLPAAP